MTFPEVLVAILLMAIFCGSVFELNAVCLRYIDTSKESVAALQSVHDRAEVLLPRPTPPIFVKKRPKPSKSSLIPRQMAQPNLPGRRMER
jgi:Tfp pilus assembly protein PilV